jgi:protein-disulfide isomerase
MMKFGSFAVGLALGAAIAGVASAALAQGMSKAQVEKIVQAYIADHGEELLSSINRSMEKAQQANLGKLINADTPVSGPADAKVTIIEFSDFQCPFCDRVQGSLKELRAKYDGKVLWAYKNLPLPFHPNAKPAAYAAIAANKQGKFWEFSKELWARQDKLTDATFVKIAGDLKLDMAKFNADRASDAVKAQVENDMAEAEAVGARGTPHFLINGQPLSGAVPTEAFAKVIDAALAAPAK